MSTVQRNSDSSQYEVVNSVGRFEIRKRLSDEGTVNYVYRSEIYKKEIKEKLPHRDIQLHESLNNLKNGNYRDIPIDEYLKELSE